MGTEIISTTLFFNKLTGAYGLLAILTGFSLNFIQLSAYLYNVAILVLLAICIPHIRRETPLPNLALAWAYTIDTLINAAYTATFALRWYLASSSAAAAAAAATSAAAAVAEAANTTVPAAVETASSTVDAITSAAASAATAAATAVSEFVLRDDTAGVVTLSNTGATAVEATPSPIPTAGGGGWMGAHETAASLTLIVLVTVVRFYFCFVVVAHTRQALQRYGDHVAESAAAADGALDDSEDYSGGDESKYHNGGEGKSERNTDIDDEEAGLKPGSRSTRGRRHRRRNRPTNLPPPRQRAQLPSGPSSTNPFAEGSPAGEGWKGKLGRALVGVGRNFWLGRQKDDEWARDVNSRFRSSATTV
ncbi:hypothetical protein Sste5346_001285 [Sporothrix stenoceras]|uniref:Uncharacterized protein n=1 Tax=Sporothrix stenoceras TaxID=5173 RepID=A0ABR3ZQ55_9PEZI